MNLKQYGVDEPLLPECNDVPVSSSSLRLPDVGVPPTTTQISSAMSKDAWLGELSQMIRPEKRKLPRNARGRFTASTYWTCFIKSLWPGRMCYCEVAYTTPAAFQWHIQKQDISQKKYILGSKLG
jgi:hypothetical protein